MSMLPRTKKAQVCKVTRRACLGKTSCNSTTNASLWLDKFIKTHDPAGRQALFNDVVNTIKEPAWYSEWFNRWKSCLGHYGAQFRKARVDGRMIIGLAHDSVLETSITLHRVLSVPYIPGTALKGVASSFAQHRLEPEWSPSLENGAHSILFGNPESAGYVTFFDAMPLPGTSRLLADVITVHHMDYYAGQDVPPADWDNPNPVQFISANGTYLIALAGPSEWVDAAFAILSHALRLMGIGARTSSGYGRLVMDPGPPAH